MRLLLLALLLPAIGCKSTTVNDGYAIDITVIVDSSVTPDDRARIATLDVEVTGDETYSKFISVAGQLSGSAGLRYRPVARSGAIDLAITANDSDGVAIAAGRITGVPLVPGVTRLETVRLIAVAAAPDLGTVDAAAFDAAMLDADSDLAGVYQPSTIASMRQGPAGAFELTDVVSIALTPGTKVLVVYVQDAAGGDYSAIGAHCSSLNPYHPCNLASTIITSADGTKVTLRGTYQKAGDIFYIESFTTNGTGTVPAPAGATLAQVARSASTPRLWFQVVNINIAAADTLQMFDFTPPEFVPSAATACPYVNGFGMLPMSATGTATAACTSGTMQPAGQTTVNPAEVLIGGDFYKTFTVSSDCRCAKMYSDVEPTSTSTVSGTVQAVLNYYPSGPTGVQYLAPKSNAAFVVTNTIPGM